MMFLLYFFHIVLYQLHQHLILLLSCIFFF
nr:MAG TPA: hypothetical protein [Caudoviricetes sp.]